MGAAAMLVLLGGIGVWIDRRASEAPISTVHDASSVTASRSAGGSGGSATRPAKSAQRETPPGLVRVPADQVGVTGERGTLAKLPPTYELTRTSSGHVAVNLAGGVSGSYGYEVLVRGTHAIRGKVIDRAGAPVTGALVLVDAEPQVRVWAGSVMANAAATSGVDGSFEILDGPETGVAFALESHAGWSAISPIASEPMTLQLLGHGALHGTLHYNGHGESFSIGLQAGNFGVSYESDPDGTFTIASLPPGAYKLHVGLAQTIAGGASKTVAREISIAADQTTEVAIDQTSGTTIAIEAKPLGTSTMEYILFTGGGSPDIASANARRKIENAPWYLLGGADVRGPAEFHDVTPGSYTVCAAADRTASYACKSLVILDGESVRELEIQLVANARDAGARSDQ